MQVPQGPVLNFRAGCRRLGYLEHQIIFSCFNCCHYFQQIIISKFGQTRSMHYSPEKTFKYSFDAQTEDSQIKAPRPKPLESAELPPEFQLEQADATWQLQQKSPFQREGHTVPRRHSLDMHYSILGFITRKISEKSRQRIMSEELHNMKL